MAKTQSGLNENIASALAYGFQALGGLIFYVTEKENKIVRFNSLQSICFFLPISIVSSIISFLGLNFISWALGVIIFITWIYLIYSAYKGKVVKLPFIGDACWNQVNK